MLFRTGVAIAAAVASLGVQAQFRTGTDIVDVYATVKLKNGTIASDLAREDFELLEDGKPREITVFSHSVQPLSVAMILDNSGSTVNDFTDIRQAAQEFVGRLLRTDRTSISTLTWACQDFTDESKDLLTVLKMQLPTDWGSPIWAATDREMERLTSESGRRIVLLFSDGVDTQDPASSVPPPPPIQPTSFMNPCTPAMPQAYKSLDSVIKRASAEGVMVYAVSVAPPPVPGMGNAGGGALAKLSKETGTQYQRLGNYSEVKAAFRSIADELHLQYLLGFVPTFTDGLPHTIDVKVKRSGVTVLARKSYIAAKK